MIDEQTMRGGDNMDDELLIQAMMDLVPHSGLTHTMLVWLRTLNASPDDREMIELFTEMLNGYGTLINVLQSAQELEGDLAERLCGGYFEHNNNFEG